MSGHGGGTPLGDAAREATAPPYIGTHRICEHSSAGICTLAPDRPRADVGICRACLEAGLFDAFFAELAESAAIDWAEPGPDRCPSCGHPYGDAWCRCQCCYEIHEESPRDV